MSKIAFVYVLYQRQKNWAWTKLCTESFRVHFPDEPLIAMDHNNIPEERAFVKQHGVTVLDSKPNSHGKGVDNLVDWCKNQGYDLMVHIEPDCLIRGRGWYNDMLDAIQNDYWMAGPAELFYGPIHPCPTMWRLDKLDCSFCRVRRTEEDRAHPEYTKLLRQDAIDKEVQRRVANNEDPDGILNWWDTGLKAWFECAKVGKAFKTRKAPDFRHFWFGSGRSLDELLIERPHLAKELAVTPPRKLFL